MSLSLLLSLVASGTVLVPLKVVGISKDTCIIFANLSASLADFKQKYYMAIGLKPKSQHVTWKGLHLDNDEISLSEYGISTDFELQLVFDMYLPVDYRRMHNIADPPLHSLQ